MELYIILKFNIKSQGATDLLERQLQEEWFNESYQCLRKFFEIQKTHLYMIIISMN